MAFAIAEGVEEWVKEKPYSNIHRPSAALNVKLMVCLIDSFALGPQNLQTIMDHLLGLPR